MGRLGSEPILSVKWSVSIGIMLNSDSDCDGHGDGTCKQSLMGSMFKISCERSMSSL